MGQKAALEPGMYALGPNSGKIQVKTFKEGLLSPLGHDLTLEATEWRATVRVDALEPPAGAVELDVPAAGLAVTAPESLTEDNRAEILRNLRGDVLAAGRYPKIRFRSASAECRCTEDGAGTLLVEGELEIRGSARKIAVPVHYRMTEAGLRVRGEAAIRQTEFGLKPYKAPLGLIRVKDEVRVLWDILIA